MFIRHNPPDALFLNCTKNTELTAPPFARTVTSLPKKYKTENESVDIWSERSQALQFSGTRAEFILNNPAGLARHESNRLEDLPHQILSQRKTTQLRPRFHRLSRPPAFRPPRRLPRRILGRPSAHR